MLTARRKVRLYECRGGVEWTDIQELLADAPRNSDMAGPSGKDSASPDPQSGSDRPRKVAKLDRSCDVRAEMPLDTQGRGVVKRKRAVDLRCKHGKVKYNCAACMPCQHGKQARYCAECHPCPHGKVNCGYVWGASSQEVPSEFEQGSRTFMTTMADRTANFDPPHGPVAVARIVVRIIAL